MALGLDPKNDSTYGYPDSEYTTEQTVGDGNKAFSRINEQEGNPYTISVEITAAGVAENNIHAAESGYSYQILQNDAVLGVVPEITYTDGLSVKDVTINFNIKDQGTAIDDLMVFKYFEDNNILLPIETSYDDTNRTVSTHVDELGTYCLINVVKWLETLNNTPAGDYYPGEGNEPANIVFCIDTRNIVDEESFEQVKADIKAITEDSFEKYCDIKVYVYYQRFGSNFKANHYLLKDADGNPYFTNYDDTAAALDTVERYMIKSNKWAYDYVSASQYMIDKCDDNIIAMYHITADDRIMGGIESAKKLKQAVLTDMYTTSDDEKIQRIHISALCLSSEKPFDTSSYAYELAQISGGVAMSGVDMEDITGSTVHSTTLNTANSEMLLTDICKIDEKTSKTIRLTVSENLTTIIGDFGGRCYHVISSTGLNTISLNKPLRKGSIEDFDRDGLSDWLEVNINAISLFKGQIIKKVLLGHLIYLHFRIFWITI
ncbi:MAG: hypothetical protein IKH75_06230 [Ruminococcus sp.]|nr:hypothetical protein [Ruminococcus sp.]